MAISATKPIVIKPQTGVFDSRSSTDEIGLGNYRMVLNCAVSEQSKLCRAGGWVPLMEESDIGLINQDLHDQLINLQLYRTESNYQFAINGGVIGYQYENFFPGSTTTTNNTVTVTDDKCGYWPDFLATYPGTGTPGSYFICDPFVGYPYIPTESNEEAPCNTGPPDFYVTSYFDVCLTTQTTSTTAGYGWGTIVPVLAPDGDYFYDYCSAQVYARGGCREALTLIKEFSSERGSRKLLVFSKSRAYELNEGTGNYRLIGDGFGIPTRNTSDANCDPCAGHRFKAAQLLGYEIQTNGFDVPMSLKYGAPASGCELHAMQPISDLIALGITKAKVVVEFKGFIFLFNVEEGGFPKPGHVIWSDFNDPLSWLPLTGISLAGSATVGFSDAVLGAEVMGDYLMIYTDKAIFRATYVYNGTATSQVFSFTQTYRGPDAIKYENTLVSTGAAHFYLANNGIYTMTQYDTRPIRLEWIHRASGVIFEGTEQQSAEFAGLSEADYASVAFPAINAERCELPCGGYRSESKELFFSWPTGSNICNNKTLRLNVQYEAGSLMDYGFSAFGNYRPDTRPTWRDWLIQREICQPSQLTVDFIKEGTGTAVDNPEISPPRYLFNATEDPNAPASADSLCAQLAGLTIEDLCGDCPAGPIFIGASASDFTLKEFKDDVYARTRYTGSAYVDDGYTSLVQSGQNDFGSEVEKVLSNVAIEYVARPQTTPSLLYAAISFGAQASCPTWKPIGNRELKCLTEKTASQHAADKTRPDLDAKYPTFYRGKFHGYRYYLGGTGGGVCFSKVEVGVRNAQTRA